MVAALGLDQVVGFYDHCPSNATDYLQGAYKDVPGNLLDPEWRNYIRKVSQARRKEQRRRDFYENDPSSAGSTRVVVHIRRGDISPCNQRYLPNSLYLRLIEQYAPKDAHVTIHSEVESHENWTEAFSNYTLVLDGNITDVWQDMLDSDILILSRSAFSIVPAIVSSRLSKVVFPPFQRYDRTDLRPLPEWDVVDAKLMGQAHAEQQEMRPTYCKKAPKKKDLLRPLEYNVTTN
jgi:hypothetical protein